MSAEMFKFLKLEEIVGGAGGTAVLSSSSELFLTACLLVFLTPEEIVDGAGSTAVFGNSSELFLEEIVDGVGINSSGLFLADCQLERLGFCSLLSALLGNPSLVVTSLL